MLESDPFGDVVLTYVTLLIGQMLVLFSLDPRNLIRDRFTATPCIHGCGLEARRGRTAAAHDGWLQMSRAVRENPLATRSAFVHSPWT